MPYTSFDPDSEYGPLHIYIYLADDGPARGRLIAVVRNVGGRDNPTPLVVNSIPLGIECKLNASPTADLTDPFAWWFGGCHMDRLDGTGRPSTDSQGTKVRRAVLAAITHAFRFNPGLRDRILIDTQVVRIETLDSQIANIQDELRDRMARRGDLLEKLETMRNTLPTDPEHDAVFGLSGD